jgi:hypothetical protein
VRDEIRRPRATVRLREQTPRFVAKRDPRPVPDRALLERAAAGRDVVRYAELLEYAAELAGWDEGNVHVTLYLAGKPSAPGSSKPSASVLSGQACVNGADRWCRRERWKSPASRGIGEHRLAEARPRLLEWCSGVGCQSTLCHRCSRTAEPARRSG